MNEIEMTGDELLEQLSAEVKKDYKAIILESWLEQEEESGLIWAVFSLKDKIGLIKIPVNVESK